MLPKDVETREQILTERQQNLPGQEKIMVYITKNSLPKNRVEIMEYLIFNVSAVKMAKCDVYMHLGICRPHLSPATT